MIVTWKDFINGVLKTVTEKEIRTSLGISDGTMRKWKSGESQIDNSKN